MLRNEHREQQLTSSRGLLSAVVAFSGATMALLPMFLLRLERWLTWGALECLKMFGVADVWQLAQEGALRTDARRSQTRAKLNLVNGRAGNMCEREQTLRNCAQACMLLDDMQFMSF